MVHSSAPPHASIRLYRLHYEIIQFYLFMIPTDEENAVRQEVIARICDVIRKYLPTASVRVLFILEYLFFTHYYRL